MRQNPTLNNPYNQILEQRRQLLAAAKRYALAPNCNPVTGQPILSSAQLRGQIIRVPIIATIVGDNFLIPTLAGKKLIYEMFIWNANTTTAATLVFYQGASATGVLQLLMENVPPQTGFIFGFNGSFEMPHFEIDNGQPFNLSIQGAGAGPIEGFIRYAVQNGTK